MNRRGVLLLELVMATFIIAVAVVGLLGGFQASVRAESELENRRRARILLERLIHDTERDGGLHEGVVEGREPGPQNFSWRVVSEETRIRSLYRVHVEVFWLQGAAEAVVYLREKEPAP